MFNNTTQHNTIKEQTKNIHSQTFPQTQPQQITESSAVHMQSLLSQHSQQQNSSMHTHNNQTLLNTQPRTQQQSGHTTVFTASECQKKSCLKSSKLITQVCTQHCAFMNLLQQKQSTTINSHQSQFHWCTAKSIDPVISTITTTQLHSHSTILSCCSFMPHTIQSFPWSQNHKITKSQNHNMVMCHCHSTPTIHCLHHTSQQHCFQCTQQCIHNSPCTLHNMNVCGNATCLCSWS